MEEAQAVPAIAQAGPYRFGLSMLRGIRTFVRKKPPGPFGFVLILIRFALTLRPPTAGFGAPELPEV